MGYQVYVFEHQGRPPLVAIARDVKEAEKLCGLPPDLDRTVHLEVSIYDPEDGPVRVFPPPEE